MGILDPWFMDPLACSVLAIGDMTRTMAPLEDKTILLGISGGIAAYKTPELVRRLRAAGADVKVIVTSAGARFVSPLSLEVVSGHPVGLELWTTDQQSRIVHTDLGTEADLIVLAPATANLVARIRHGFANDLLSTTVMACQTPVLVCPSMNTDMLQNPHVQENLEALATMERYTVLDADRGELACGVVGEGRLPDAPGIIEAAAALLTPSDLAGVRVTVTAGPTREALDPVRFLSNRSTGTMGYEMARGFVRRGARVTLVAGPNPLDVPRGLASHVAVASAAEMAGALDGSWPQTDVLIMAAAVADWRPAKIATQKLKKANGPLVLEMERTEDILCSLSERQGREDKVLLGFAAETERLIDQARQKLETKDLDWIVANQVGEDGVGFGPGDNEGVLLGKDGSETTIARAHKALFADLIIGHVAPSIRDRVLGGGADVDSP